MMEDKKNFDDLKGNVSRTAGKFVKAASEKISSGIEWAVENPEKAIAIASGAVALTAGLLRASQSLAVNHRLKMEYRRKDLRFYDPHTRIHWDLKRKLTNNDRVRILDATSKGRRIDEVLREMNLLK